MEGYVVSRLSNWFCWVMKVGECGVLELLLMWWILWCWWSKWVKLESVLCCDVVNCWVFLLVWYLLLLLLGWLLLIGKWLWFGLEYYVMVILCVVIWEVCCMFGESMCFKIWCWDDMVWFCICWVYWLEWVLIWWLLWIVLLIWYW